RGARRPAARPVRDRQVHGLGGHRGSAASARRGRATPPPGHPGARMSTAPRTGYQDRHPLIGPARQDHLHVMTFNLRYDNSSATAAGEADHWPERRPLMIDLLA